MKKSPSGSGVANCRSAVQPFGLTGFAETLPVVAPSATPTTSAEPIAALIPLIINIPLSFVLGAPS